jgi:pyruvate dehydrogenase E2 component (dihydrolipoamide acetyltransferase)
LEDSQRNGEAREERRQAQRVPLKGMRKAIAKRMLESLSTMAQMSSSAEVDVTRLLEFRGRLVQDEDKLGTRVSVTDVFAWIAVNALKENPEVNASMTDTEILLYPYVNLAVAVALPGGLICPVIRDADRMGLAELSKSSKELIERAKQRKLTMDDMEGGTFTLSSMGPNATGGFGTPIINPPQSGIMQIGPSIRKPVVVEEQIVIRSMMIVNFTFDHRLVDGMAIAGFVRSIKKYVIDPALIRL